MATSFIIGKLVFLREEVSVLAFSVTSLFKFDGDGAVKGKPNLTGIGGVLRYDKWEVLVIFPKYEGIKESTETEVLGIYKDYCSLLLFMTN